MATVSELIQGNAAAVGSKTQCSTISPADVAGRLDALASEFVPRGMLTVTGTAGLATTDPNNSAKAFVPGVGIFTPLTTGVPPDMVTTFPSTVPGVVWQNSMPATVDTNFANTNLALTDNRLHDFASRTMEYTGIAGSQVSFTGPKLALGFNTPIIQPKTLLSVGAIPFNVNALVTINSPAETSADGIFSNLYSNRRRVLANAETPNNLCGILSVGYLLPDATVQLPNDYQLGVLSAYFSGGFLNKPGVATTTVQLGVTPHTSTSVVGIKVLTQGNDQILNGWMSALRTTFSRVSSTGQVENYADIIVGSTDGTPNITNRYGLLLNPIKAPSVVNAYGVYQSGNDDTNEFYGLTRVRGANHFQYIDGTEGVDKILTSDAAGVASWKAPAVAASKAFLGVIYDKSNWTDLSDFTNVSATASIVGGKIQMSGGVNNLNQFLALNYVTGVEYFKITMLATQTVMGAGFGIGIRGLVGAYASTQLTSLTANYNPAVALFSIGYGAVPVPFVGNAGDQFEITLELKKNILTGTIRNITTNSATVTTSKTLVINVDLIPNTGKPSIFSVGGTFLVDRFSYASQSIKRADMVVIGDSKTKGYYATYETRYTELLQADYEVVNSSGGSETTQEALLKVPELIALAPKYALMAIGSNDIRGGIAAATYQGRYNSIVTQLEAAGIKVYHLLPFWEDVTAAGGLARDVTPLVNYILATYPADRIIDTNKTLKEPGTLDTDGVHPTVLGMQRIYEDISDAFKFEPVKGKPSVGSISGNFIQNQNLVYQAGAFKIQGSTSDIKAGLIVGSGTDVVDINTSPFRVRTGPDQLVHISGFGISNYIAAVNYANTGFKRMFFGAQDFTWISNSPTSEVQAMTLDGVGNMVVRTSVVINNAAATTFALRINTTTNFQLNYYHFSGINTIESSNAGRSDGQPVRLMGKTISLTVFNTVITDAITIASDTSVNILKNAFIGGATAPTARLHLAAGGTAAGSAPLKLTSSGGSGLSTPEDGAFEYFGSKLWYTIAGTRREVTLV